MFLEAANYQAELTLPDGTELAVRQITPADREALARAFDRLSPRARELRFLTPKDRLSSRELDYLTRIDHRTHEALVAIEPETGRWAAVARYATAPPESRTAELAITVADQWQSRGVGTGICRLLVARAGAEGIATLEALTQPRNLACQVLLTKLGFEFRSYVDGLAHFDLALEVAVAA